MGVCLICEHSIIRKASEAAACAKCSGLAHFTCININISKNSFDGIKKGTHLFICNKCKKKSSSGDISKRDNTPVRNSEGEKKIPDDKQNENMPAVSEDVLNAIQAAILKGQESATRKSTDLLKNSLMTSNRNKLNSMIPSAPLLQN